jgi:hypothetical protein
MHLLQVLLLCRNPMTCAEWQNGKMECFCTEELLLQRRDPGPVQNGRFAAVSGKEAMVRIYETDFLSY